MNFKRILRSALVVAIAAGTTVGSTGAFFTSSVTAANNQIIAGTLRLSIDSTQVHVDANPFSWGFPNAYTVAEDVNGVSTFYNTLETWTNAAPGTFVPYNHPIHDGADVLPDGNHSYWVAFRNNGTIPFKVSGNVTGGSWTPNASVAATTACQNVSLNAVPTVFVKNVHFYANDNCEGHEECENIYYGLKTGPWLNAPITALDYHNPLYAPITTAVRASSDGTNTGTPVQIGYQQFIIARVDVNFDTTAAGANQNCYQGATFNYTLNGNAYQMADPAW